MKTVKMHSIGHAVRNTFLALVLGAYATLASGCGPSSSFSSEPVPTANPQAAPPVTGTPYTVAALCTEDSGKTCYLAVTLILPPDAEHPEERLVAYSTGNTDNMRKIVELEALIQAEIKRANKPTIALELDDSNAIESFTIEGNIYTP